MLGFGSGGHFLLHFIISSLKGISCCSVVTIRGVRGAVRCGVGMGEGEMSYYLNTALLYATVDGWRALGRCGGFVSWKYTFLSVVE